MTFEKEIKIYLESPPLAREQKFVNQATWGFLSRKYKFEVLEKDLFYKIGTKFDSVRRLIAKVQEECSELRGEDWSERKVREQAKQLELGVAEMGHNETLKI